MKTKKGSGKMRRKIRAPVINAMVKSATDKKACKAVMYGK